MHLILCLSLGIWLPLGSSDPEVPEWETDFEVARSRSRSSGRPILANFTGSDWCGWCIRLKKEVFATPEFAAWAAEQVVLLELDYPRRKVQDPERKQQNQMLARKYRIEGYPTILFLDAEGMILARSGYAPGGFKAWTADANRKLERARKEQEARRAEARGLWGTQFDVALAAAQKTGKPVLASFTGSDWCAACQRLESEVFAQPGFAAWAREHVILLQIDYPRHSPQDADIQEQNRKLLARYEVSSLPSVLFLDGHGEVQGRLGYEEGGVSAWTQRANRIITRDR